MNQRFFCGAGRMRRLHKRVCGTTAFCCQDFLWGFQRLWKTERSPQYRFISTDPCVLKICGKRRLIGDKSSPVLDLRQRHQTFGRRYVARGVEPGRTDANMNAITKEAVRQQRETFEELKRQNRQWFALRLTMGYSAVVLLLGVLTICGAILLDSHLYPGFVVKAASAALFADVLGLLLAVWKFALNPSFHNRLHPVTCSPEATRSTEIPGA
jgi:hypothetical protein